MYNEVIIPRKITEHDEHASLPEGVTIDDVREVERVIIMAYTQAEYEIGLHQSNQPIN